MMGPHEASESQLIGAVASDNGLETSLSRPLRSIHPAIFSRVASTARMSDNNRCDNMTEPTSPPSLPRPGQPFPFILPHPLGPVSTPTGNCPRPDFTIRNTPGPANTSMLSATHSQVDSTTGPRMINPDNTDGFLMPHPTAAPIAGNTRGMFAEKTAGPGVSPPQHGLSCPSHDQMFPQQASNRWEKPAVGARSSSGRGNHDSMLGGPSAGGFHDGNWGIPQRFHNFDESNEGLKTSTWEQQYERSRLQRFRCGGCGVAYIDEALLVVSIHPLTNTYAACLYHRKRHIRITGNATKVLWAR